MKVLFLLVFLFALQGAHAGATEQVSILDRVGKTSCPSIRCWLVKELPAPPGPPSRIYGLILPPGFTENVSIGVRNPEGLVVFDCVLEQKVGIFPHDPEANGVFFTIRADHVPETKISITAEKDGEFEGYEISLVLPPEVEPAKGEAAAD